MTSDPSFVSNLLLLRHVVLEGSTALVIARINYLSTEVLDLVLPSDWCHESQEACHSGSVGLG